MVDNIQSESKGKVVSFTEDELVRLRELASTPRKPWWRDYPLLIAGAGFVLALITGLISAYVGYRKDIHEQQAQLATTLQTIQELTLKQVEVYNKYSGQTIGPSISNLIGAEVNTALRTASDLAFRLGSNATTSELTTIAQGQYGLGDLATAGRLLEIALSVAQNANDESISLRQLGFLKIQIGNDAKIRQDGETLFFQAMSLDIKWDIHVPYAIHFLRASAALDWANAIGSFDCPGAQRHFAEGIENLLANPRTPEMDQMRQVTLGAYTNGLGGVSTCKPLAQPVLPP